MSGKVPTITSYSKEAIISLLNGLITTQEYIENSSEIFMRLGKDNLALIPELVKDWLEVFNQNTRRSDKPKTFISFFYLANDIIQKCGQKGCPQFKDSFKDVLVETFSFCLNHPNEKFKNDIKDIRKIIEIWQERKVYPKEFLKNLSNAPKQKEEKRGFENISHNVKGDGTSREGPVKEKGDGGKKIPDNPVEIPQEFVNFSQNHKTMRKWTEKSEENRKKLNSLENSKPQELDFIDLDCILAEYKRCLGLEQKYRKECLTSAKEILKNMEANQTNMVEELKKVLGVIDQIEEIERRFLDNR